MPPKLAERLLQRNPNGKGSKSVFTGRAPSAYMQALDQLHRETGLSKSRILVETSLGASPKLSQRLRQLASQYLIAEKHQ